MILLVMINKSDLNEFKKNVEKITKNYQSKTNKFFKILVDEEKAEFLAKKQIP
jgi:hypothetical protein